jgi:hypothetical protein
MPVSALGAGDALRSGADLAAEARGAVPGAHQHDAGADERRGARRDGDGEADQGGDAVREVPRGRQPLAGGVRGGRRRLGRGARAAQLPGAERGGGVVIDGDSLGRLASCSLQLYCTYTVCSNNKTLLFVVQIIALGEGAQEAWSTHRTYVLIGKTD